jgi:putative molybdopterin biosynthesis protein
MTEIPVQGADAFRSEMVPADGTGIRTAGTDNVAVTLLDDQEALARTVVLAGCTPMLSLWARSAERWFPGLRVQWRHANSMEALRSLSRGEVHAAGIHLCDPATGEYNAPFVREILPGRATVLVNLGVWNEGFVVAPGNPKEVRDVTDLTRKGMALINREAGAGSRLLLDTLLDAAGVPAKAIAGYTHTVSSHQEIALAIAAGQADAGISTEAIARTYGLGFVPLQQVRYDLALLEEYLHQEPIRQLLSTLQHRWVRSQLSILGGYDTTTTGETTHISSAPTRSK